MLSQRHFLDNKINFVASTSFFIAKAEYAKMQYINKKKVVNGWYTMAGF